ncbi:hypothetical protein Fmac_005997 [Flemingia macrophylla]|uniref:Uncharacterized protein n=1 Tax=Flemingia macrophylla TaxID=520843 RepID=A0ABD1N9E3_9FABA
MTEKRTSMVEEENMIMEALRTVDFWILFVSFLCGVGTAIETDSYKETRDLISYWILLSLIYLFEYAFSRLLLWFQLWPYIKLMIIFWLIIPDFGQASNAYSFIRNCISLNPHTVICRLNNWRELFVKKDDFLLHVGMYVKENGTEALEKLITSKNTTYKLDVEVTNAIRATDNKEMQQGLKTGMYYLRSRSTADAIKFTVDTTALKIRRIHYDQFFVAAETNLKEWTAWTKVYDRCHEPALLHASVDRNRKLIVDWVPAGDLEDVTYKEDHKAAWSLLKGANGVLVPGGFGDRGVQGKILAAKLTNAKCEVSGNKHESSREPSSWLASGVNVQAKRGMLDLLVFMNI